MLILKQKTRKKKNLHLRYILLHIFKNNHVMYIQMHAKIAAGVEFQEPLVKVEVVALTILFLARNGAFISQAQKV